VGTLGTRCVLRRGGAPSAGTDAALPTAVQEEGRRALPFYGEIDPEDRPEELGVASESLRRRIRHHEIDAGKPEGLTTDGREELRRLRRENRVLKQEKRS
jgi:hypothetical protein